MAVGCSYIEFVHIVMDKEVLCLHAHTQTRLQFTVSQPIYCTTSIYTYMYTLHLYEYIKSTMGNWWHLPATLRKRERIWRRIYGTPVQKWVFHRTSFVNPKIFWRYVSYLSYCAWLITLLQIVDSVPPFYSYTAVCQLPWRMTKGVVISDAICLLCVLYAYYYCIIYTW